MKLKKMKNVLRRLDDCLRTSCLTIIPGPPGQEYLQTHHLRIADTQIETNESRLLIKNSFHAVVIPRKEISQFCFELVGSNSHMSIKTKSGCEIAICINSEKGWV